MNQALQEAQQCSDLLSQSSYHQQRARKKDEEEQSIRRKQDEERQKLREKQTLEAEDRRRKEDERRQMEREKRQEFVERTKNLLNASESQGPSEKGHRSAGSSKKRPKHEHEEEEFINDTHDLLPNTDRAPKKRTRKSDEHGEKREKKSSK